MVMKKELYIYINIIFIARNLLRTYQPLQKKQQQQQNPSVHSLQQHNILTKEPPVFKA